MSFLNVCISEGYAAKVKPATKLSGVLAHPADACSLGISDPLGRPSFRTREQQYLFSASRDAEWQDQWHGAFLANDRGEHHSS